LQYILGFYILSLSLFLPRASTTSAALVTLDTKIESISAQAAAKRASKEEYEKALQAVIKDVGDRQRDKGGMHRKSTFERDLMDVDDMHEHLKGKNRK
jgi:COP9 signalosome complex subunit 7